MDATVAISPSPAKRLDLFERYLSLWVLVCMVAGILVGKSAPETIDRLSHWEFLSGSQVNAPIAILIWLKSISEIVIGSAGFLSSRAS
jgi:arsenite transporter